MINHNFRIYALVFCSLFIIGFSLMGYEMLGSRYLNPYFGGGITTWAALISVVLFAMMSGYMIGGYVIDHYPKMYMLPIVSILAGCSIITLPFFIDPALEYILETFGDGMWGVLIASVIISLLPVGFLSACSPFVIRLLLSDLSAGGRTAGWVYGVSTLGNVLGTLTTTFLLIPSFGTRTITYFFGMVLITLGIIYFLIWRRIGSKVTLKTLAVCVFTAFLAIPEPGYSEPATTHKSFYPEGPLWVGKRLYFAEMPMDRIMYLENGKTNLFWRRDNCGPTALAKYGDGFIILCHLSRKLVHVTNRGRSIREYRLDHEGKPFQNPNDAHSDGKGGVFFSDSGVFKKGAAATGKIYHIDSEGQISLMFDGLAYANGIAFDAAKQRLLFSEHLAGRVWDVRLTDAGDVKNKQILFDMKNTSLQIKSDYPEVGTDGIEFLKNGDILVAIFGSKRFVLLSDKDQHQSFETPLKYITNIATHGEKLAIVGAFQQKYPSPGQVIIKPVSELYRNERNQ